MRASWILAAVSLWWCGPALADTQATGLQMPEFETVGLDNGLTLMLMEHATVPLVSVEVWVDAGAIYDPDGKEGLANLTAEALRKGAGEKDATELAQALDFLGARFSSSVNSDRVRLRLELLAKDLPEGLSLLGDMLLRPTFDAKEMQKLAGQLAESVTSSKENPRFVLADYHRAHLFGDHPYGKPVEGTETSLPSLGRDDVAAFHRDHYGADRTLVAVVGDVDTAQVEQWMHEIFDTMPRARASRRELSPPEPPAHPSVTLVNKNDTPQTWFRIGSVGPAWDQPDYAATELVRTIFGGRFTSWLNTTLRIESGLTYGAGFQIARGRTRGSAAIATFTATENTRQAIDLALAQLDRLHDEGLSQADLASAKAYVKGQMPYDYETAEDLATVLCELRFYGRDRSFVDGLFEAIDAVDLKACRAAIDRWFTRENLVVTAIGKADEVKDVLDDYGPLTVRENDAPGFR
jgi:predicted Zn-dependent peptidase